MSRDCADMYVYILCMCTQWVYELGCRSEHVPFVHTGVERALITNGNVDPELDWLLWVSHSS